MVDSTIAENLARFGFSSYETKAYIALLNKHPATGYELAKRARIPPSKIYEVLDKLLNKSVVLPTQTKPVKYVPQDVTLVLKKIRNETTRAIASLAEHLPKRKIDVSRYVWQLNDRDELLHKARELILASRREIIISAWEQELRELLPALSRRKRLKIAIVAYGDIFLPVGTVYYHTIANIKKSEKGGREFTLVTDNANMLQAIIPGAKPIAGVWTTNESLVDVARDFIIHEIYCWKMINKCVPHVQKIFGKNFEKLRNVFKQ